MDAIELMKEEHKNIKRGLVIFRKLSIEILNGGDVDFDAFEKMISFVRNYADKHHHGKEEKVLFNKMETSLGDAVVKGPLSGMYIEHDYGRLFMKTLEEALKRVKDGDNDSKVDVIANSIGYTDLLTRHIDKEDNVFYSFARRMLSSEALEEVDKRCEDIESEAGKDDIQENYLNILSEMERKLQIWVFMKNCVQYMI